MGLTRRERRAAARPGLRENRQGAASVRVHVRELVLRGIETRSRYDIAEAASAQIASLMTSNPPETERSTAIDDIVRTRIAVGPASSLGSELGSALHSVVMEAAGR